jgi:hypothetical protein
MPTRTSFWSEGRRGPARPRSIGLDRGSVSVHHVNPLEPLTVEAYLDREQRREVRHGYIQYAMLGGTARHNEICLGRRRYAASAAVRTRQALWRL